MQKTAEHYRSDVVDTRDDSREKITWTFPISEVAPKNFVVQLGRGYADDKHTSRISVQVKGLGHPQLIVPEGGPTYVGDRTKDPVLLAQSNHLLDRVEAQIKGLVPQEYQDALSEKYPATPGKLPAVRLIEKEYSHGPDSSFLRFWRQGPLRGAEMDEMFVKVEAAIDAMVPEIESTVAVAAGKRGELMTQGNPVPEATGRELFAAHLAEQLVPRSADGLDRLRWSGAGSVERKRPPTSRA